jgi:hypothetical protein
MREAILRFFDIERFACKKLKIGCRSGTPSFAEASKGAANQDKRYRLRFLNNAEVPGLEPR